MPFIGKTPTAVPLTANDISDGIISTDKLADTSVTNAKLNADIISAETELATAPADTDEFLISDAGTLKRIDASLVGGGGITEMDQWRLTTSFTSSGLPITSNLERNDTNFAYVGTGMSESSGVFTFPSTGIYLIMYQIVAYGNSIGDIRYAGGSITATTDNASYSNLSEAYNGCNNHGSDYYFSSFQQAVFDVTNVSTHKIRLQVAASSSSVIFKGSTSINATSVTFLRIGDT